VTSFIHSGYLYSAHLGNLLRGALNSATAKRKGLKKFAERRRNSRAVPRQQAQHKKEFILPSEGTKHRESSTLLKRRAGPRNQELPKELQRSPK